MVLDFHSPRARCRADDITGPFDWLLQQQLKDGFVFNIHIHVLFSTELNILKLLAINRCVRDFRPKLNSVGAELNVVFDFKYQRGFVCLYEALELRAPRTHGAKYREGSSYFGRGGSYWHRQTMGKPRKDALREEFFRRLDVKNGETVYVESRWNLNTRGEEARKLLEPTLRYGVNIWRCRSGPDATSWMSMAPMASIACCTHGSRRC